jgi:hypothetical protein
MTKILETLHGKSYSVEIRMATSSDIQGLTDINHRWQREILGNDTTHGFLSAAFSFDTFKALVDSNEVVVGILDSNVISYYIVNSISTDGVLFKHGQIVNGLKEKSIIPQHSRVGLGSQALVDKEFQGSHLRKLMLNELVKFVSEKYDFLFSTISKQNTRAFNAHTKDGWKVVSEDQDTNHVILDIKNYIN